MENEQWLPVVHFEGYYEVSNYGQIRSVAPGQGRRTDRVLGDWRTSHGYRQVELQVANKSSGFLVHRLVAEAFLGPCPFGKEVDHRDGDKENNLVSNLRYVTRSENMLARNERLRTAGLPLSGLQHGEHNPQAVLTWKKVAEIRAFAAEGMPQRSIAEIFGVRRETIGKIIRGERWAKSPDGKLLPPA